MPRVAISLTEQSHFGGRKQFGKTNRILEARNVSALSGFPNNPKQSIARFVPMKLPQKISRSRSLKLKRQVKLLCSTRLKQDMSTSSFPPLLCQLTHQASLPLQEKRNAMFLLITYTVS